MQVATPTFYLFCIALTFLLFALVQGNPSFSVLALLPSLVTMYSCIYTTRATGAPVIPTQYPLFKQCDPKWANVTMGGSKVLPLKSPNDYRTTTQPIQTMIPFAFKAVR